MDLNFEIGVNESKSQIKDEANMKHIGYVKLIHNSEPEFSHFADQELTFDEIVLEFKKCGVLIAPWKEDLESVGIKEKVIYTYNINKEL